MTRARLGQPGRLARRLLVVAGRSGLQLLVPIALVVLWWRTSAASSSPFYPPASEVIESLREDWLSDWVHSDLLPSLRRFGLGYVLAATLGVVVGTLLGLAPRWRRAATPVTELVRSIPPSLLFPFALVVFGIGDGSKVALITLGAVWPVLLNTLDGVRGVDPQVLDVARSFRIGRWRQVTRIVLPAASPKIMAGLRIALSVALLLMVVSEMQGGTDGVGFRIRSAERGFDTDVSYAGVIVIGAVGLVANLLFVAVEGWVMRWHRGARGLAEGPSGQGALA